MENEPIGIQLHPVQVEAINNGATTFIVMVDLPKKYEIHNNELCIENDEVSGLVPVGDMKEVIERYSPLQVGQKFFMQEDFCIYENKLYFDDKYLDE